MPGYDGQRCIADLGNGEHCFTTPWGLREYDGRWFLHPQYPARRERVGTATMEVALIRGQFYAWPDDGERLTVTGLAGFGGPEDCGDVADVHDRLAAMFDELGEPGMAADQRRIAEAFRSSRS